MRIFGIFLWHKCHCAGIHAAYRCKSGVTNAMVTHVLLQSYFWYWDYKWRKTWNEMWAKTSADRAEKAKSSQSSLMFYFIIICNLIVHFVKFFKSFITEGI